MTQAKELAKLISPLVAVQGGIVYLLCEDGSQLSIKIHEATADTQWTESAQIETYCPTTDEGE